MLCFCSKVTVSLRYTDLILVLPTRVTVLAWPMLNKNSTTTLNRMEDGVSGNHPLPVRLSYAEDALRTMSLPEGENYIILVKLQENWETLYILYVCLYLDHTVCFECLMNKH